MVQEGENPLNKDADEPSADLLKTKEEAEATQNSEGTPMEKPTTERPTTT